MKWFTRLFVIVMASLLSTACCAQQERLRLEQQKLLKALSESTSFEFRHTPLEDVADFVKGRHGVEIRVDGDALAEAKISKDVPITINVKGITLGSGLLVALRNVGLVAVLREGSLLVTTPARAHNVGGAVPGLTTPKAPIKATPTSRGNKILAVLNDNTNFKFAGGIHLANFVESLEDQHNVPILIDLKALSDAKISPNATVMQSIEGVSLRSALRFTLHQLDLTCARQDEFLVITTPREADFWGGALPPMGSPAKKINNTLKQNAKFRFHEEPLDHVVKLLKDQHAIPILLERKALRAANIGSDVPVTQNLEGISLRSALLLTLRELGLTCACQNDFLIVTTPREADYWGGAVPPVTSPPEKIKNALKDATRLEFIETRLKDVVSFLRDRHDIPIIIDRRGLADAGIGPDIPVTQNIKGISLQSGLRLMLDELKLTHVVENEVLLITTQERRAKLPVPKVTIDQKTLDAIGGDTRLQFVNTPLEDVLAFMEDQHRIEIKVDHRGLADAKVSTDVPITASFRDVSLGAALLITLRNVGLVCVAQEGFLMVTTPARVSDWGGVLPGLTAPKPTVKSGSDPSLTNVLDALEQETRIEFIRTPLDQTVDSLGTMHNVQIIIDLKAMRDTNISPQLSVTESMRDISLRSALLLMLRKLELTCARQERFLVITTPREADFWGGALPPFSNSSTGATNDDVKGNITSLSPTLQKRRRRIERIDNALKQGASFGFVGTPLGTVVDFLRSQYKIPIFLDLKALRAANIGRDVPVRQSIKGVSLRSALLLTLGELGLACAWPGDFLIVTTPREADYWGGVLVPLTSRPEKIKDALESATRLEFIETPLQDAVRTIRDGHGIPIIIDRPALAEVGIGPDIPITRNIKRTTLGSALRLILDELKLTYVVENEALLITTPKGRKTRATLEGRITDENRNLPTYRTWKDITGRYSTEAQLVRESGGKVMLRKTDGSTVVVPLERLSAQDQQWVRSHRDGP